MIDQSLIEFNFLSYKYIILSPKADEGPRETTQVTIPKDVAGAIIGTTLHQTT